MPDIRTVQNLLLANAPPNVQAQAQAGADAVQRAAAPSAPYTSRMAGLAKALQGGLGGLMEGSAMKQAMDGQQAGRSQMLALADALHGASGGGGAASGGMSAPVPSAMAQGQGGMIPGSSPTGPANALPMGDAGSRDLAIRTIYGEAGGEPAQGQAGVAAVLRNRLAGGQYGKDMQSVIMAPKQFSLWNPGDPAGASAKRLEPSSPAYQRIGQIYDGVMSGQIADPTGGATHYYNPKVASPAWGPKLAAQNDVMIGNHRFVGAGPAGPNGGDPGISASPRSAAGQLAATPGSAVALPPGSGNTDPGIAADMPARGAQPVASSSLPPGITPDMVSAPPQSDGSVRGDLLAAAAQHGGLDPDAPAPNAVPTGMQGLPPGVTPAMWAASQGPSADLHRFDEVPAGTKPYVPGSTPGPAAPPISPATSNATAAAVLSTIKPDLGQTQAAVVPDPVSASAPDAPPPPSILPPTRPPSGDVAGPASVPAPTGALAPPPPPPPSDGSVRGDLIAAAQQHGMDVAMDPIVPDPQGSMVPPTPSSPNDALVGPQSDAAAGGADLGGAGIPAAPQASLPDTAPLPPPGAQSLQAPADAASAAAAAGRPELDPEAVGLPGGDPSLRDTITAAMKGDGGQPAPSASTPAPAPAPVSAAPNRLAAADVGDPGLDAMRAGMVAQGPGGGPSPGSAPLPMMAQAGAPGPTPMPPQPGTGAALPQTGPMPPPGVQSMGAGSSLPQTGPMPPPGVQSLAAAGGAPDAPAPNAVPAGPMPLSSAPGGTSPLAAALAPQQFGGSGTNAVAGNSPSADPSSAVNFMRSEAARASGGSTPTPGGLMAGIMGAGTPARGQGAPGSGMLGMGGPAMGGAVQPPPAVPSPASAPSGGPAPAASQGTAPVPAAAAPAAAASPPSGNFAQARAIAAQVLSNPYAQPAAVEMASKILFPQSQVVTGGDGKTYAVNPMEGTARLLFDGGANFKPNESLLQGGKFTQAPSAPMDLAPGHVATTFGANNQAIPQVQAPNTPSFEPVQGTGLAMDKTSGAMRQIPGGVNGTATLEAGGAKVPYATNTGPNGTTATPLVGGTGAPGQPGQGPLDAVKPIVDQANAMKAQGDAQADEAKTQVTDLGKTAQTGIAARQKLQTLNELSGLSQKFGNGFGARIGNFLHEHGVSTQTGSDQEAFNGLSTALAIDERPTGSGALRTAEIEGFKRQAGSPTQTPADRLAAIGRLSNVFQRDAQAGDLAANSSIPSDQRTAMVHQLYALPYDRPVAVTPADAMKLPPGTQFRDMQGNVRVVPGQAR